MKKFFALFAVLTVFFCAARIARMQDAPPSIDEKLERERLAALPALKAQLEDRKLRERSDLIIILNERFFDKMLAELSSSKFDAGGLFVVTIQNPRVTIKNGFVLARMEALLQPANQMLSINASLKVTARLLIEKGPMDSLIAKIQVVDLQPSDPKSNAPTAFSPEQLTQLLPPLTLPLEFDFDQKIDPGSMKQDKPIAFEVNAEPRRFRGHFEVMGLLPLDGRIAVFARTNDLQVK